jgi:hypothetical protein
MISVAISHVFAFTKEAIQPTICTQLIFPSLIPTALCRRSPPGTGSADFDSFTKLQSRLESVLSDSAIDPSLSVNLQRSQAAIDDLSVLVRLSQLPSKDRLADKMDEVVIDAKAARKALQKLASRSGAAVYSIQSMDEYALLTLERLAASSPKGLPGANLLRRAMFLPARVAPTRDGLVVVFSQTVAHIRETLLDLIIQAERTEGILDRLEGHLKAVSEITQQDSLDGATDQENRPRLMKLWVSLGGGHDGGSNELQSHLNDVVREMGIYGNRVHDRVHRTTEQLQKLVFELEVKMVTKPAVVVKEAAVPLEVDLQSIRNVLENLAVFRRRAIEQENESSRIITHLSGLTDGPAIGS